MAHLILGIETSCDETAAAVVADGQDVRSNLIASQFDLHAKYGGIVPELASRAHLERLDDLIREALQHAAVDPHDLSAIAVTSRPGLIGALLIGVTAAKTLAWAWGKPLIAVNHIHAHATSAAIEGGRVEGTAKSGSGMRGPGSGEPAISTDSLWPAVALVVSGGHTSLFLVRNPCDLTLLGATRDDAAGEAFDKVAMTLGLGFPGGPVIDRRAKGGDAGAIAFPRTMLEPDSLDFSFSGLKTAVLYHVHGPGRTSGGLERLAPRDIDDICASFSAAVVDVLVAKTVQAARRTGVNTVVVGGGVAANSMLRARLSAACREHGFNLHLTSMKYCTDNAAMIAAQGYSRFLAGDFADLHLTAEAS